MERKYRLRCTQVPCTPGQRQQTGIQQKETVALEYSIYFFSSQPLEMKIILTLVGRKRSPDGGCK